MLRMKWAIYLLLTILLSTISLAIADDFISYYPLYTDANDYNNVNNLSATGSPTQTTSSEHCHNGECYYFPGGTGTYFSIAAATGFITSNNPRTTCAWVKESSGGSYVYAAAQGTSSGSNGWWTVAFNNLNNPIMLSGTTNSPALGAVSLNSTNYICFAWDGTKRIGYLNGTNIANSTDGVATSSTKFMIGANPNGDEGVNGWISDVTYWNRTLAPQEINELFLNDGIPYATVAGDGNLSIDWITPTTNDNHTQNELKEYTFNVSCSGGNCNGVSVWLDPEIEISGTDDIKTFDTKVYELETFNEVIKVTDDIKKLGTKALILGDNKFVVEASATINELGNMSETKEWWYNGIGDNHENVTCKNDCRILLEDYICDNNPTVGNGLLKTYSYECIYYPKQFKNITIDKKLTEVETRVFNKKYKDKVIVEFLDIYDPTYTILSFAESWGDDNTNGTANTLSARPDYFYNNMSHALTYYKFNGNFIDEIQGDVVMQKTCKGFYRYGVGFDDGLTGFGFGNKGVEITGCDEREWYNPSIQLNVTYRPQYDNIFYNGTWNMWFKIENPHGTATESLGRMNINSVNWFRVGVKTTGVLDYAVYFNGTLQQNLQSVNKYNDSTWHLLSIVWNSNTGNITSYIDGVYDITFRTDFNQFTEYYGTQEVIMSTDNDASNATVDEYIVFDYPKSQEEILADYNNYISGYIGGVNNVTLKAEIINATTSLQYNYTTNNSNVKVALRGQPEIPALYEMWDYSWATIKSDSFMGLKNFFALMEWDDDNLPGLNNCLNYTETFRGSPTFDARCDGTSTAVENPTGMRGDNEVWNSFHYDNPEYMLFAWVKPRTCNGPVIVSYDARPALQLDAGNSSECDQFLVIKDPSSTGKYCWSANRGIMIGKWNLYGMIKNSSGYHTVVYNEDYPEGVHGNCQQTSTLVGYTGNMINGTYGISFHTNGIQFRGSDAYGSTGYIIDEYNLDTIKNIFNGTYAWTNYTEAQYSGSTYNFDKNVSYIQPKYVFTGAGNITKYNIITDVQITPPTPTGKGIINNTVGANPFYHNGTSVSISCGDMTSGDSCSVSFYVNATGSLSNTYEFFGIANSTNALGANSTTINITIVAAGGAADTCTCAGLNNDWNVSMSDYCYIDTNCNLGTGTLTFYNNGFMNISAIINTTGLGTLTSAQTIYIHSDGVLNIY